MYVSVWSDCRDNGGKTYLEEIARENRAIVLDHGLSLSLTVAQDLVNACLLVPAGYGEEVLLVGRIGVESEVADAVLGRLTELDILLEIAEGVARRCGSGTEKTSHVWLALGVVRLE